MGWFGDTLDDYVVVASGLEVCGGSHDLKPENQTAA